MEKGFWQKLKQPIIGLSPMDGVTDAAFRTIIAKYGKPSVIFTEFTSAEALKYGSVKTLKTLAFQAQERPIVAQIYGKDVEAFYQATIMMCALGFDGVDINMGCPSKGVAGNGAGAALIANPELALEIIASCQKGLEDWANGIKLEAINLHPDILSALQAMKLSTQPSLLPLSIKTRIGFNSIITEEWISTIASTKPALICVHGRTLKQMYSGQANWEEIGKAGSICRQNDILILGNGDIEDFPDAHHKIKEFRLDGVLIGRATFGNPWIFQNKSASRIKRLETAIEHSHLHQKLFDATAFDAVKKHLGWYCKDFPGAKELRIDLMKCANAREVEALIKDKLHESGQQNDVKSEES